MNQQLLTAIRQRLGGAIAPNLTTASKGYDLFEAYVFTLVLDAADRQGASIAFENDSGTPVSTFQFRTSPGQLGRGNYSHARLNFGPRKPELEVHVGVYLAGVSKVAHEADVAVILRDEAQLSRATGALPRYSSLILAAECKFYQSAVGGAVGVGLGRGFLGLNVDLANRIVFFVMTRGSGNVAGLLAHHKKRWDASIVPSSPNDVNRLVSEFETVFRDFKARRS